mmetsp:Transcript_11264/g.21077  ORF Transcript_11264/g.21077 Transcript_11264/m.21077 type:complete len:516 (+) Transcript_11264:238-1785(+)
MSQQLIASALTRVTTTTLQFGKSSILPHPAVPLKSTMTVQKQCNRVITLQSTHDTVKYSQRIYNNVSRLYARRMIELASFSAATMASTTQMESRFMIEKPKEWQTIDLVEQRKQFGESISSLGKTKLSRVWAAGSRIANLALLASPLIILTPVAFITSSDSKPNKWAWNYAVWAIEQAGPTFIKLTQWATTRNDLFSSDFIEHFSKLQDNTRGHSWKETEKILKDAFGEDYMDLFQFESGSEMRQQDKISPIGSGCIAQVYKAKLKSHTNLISAGSDVAIKVTHPHILHKVCVDFYILNKITEWIESIPYVNLDYLSMKDSVEQFRDIMLPQLDLRVEARNLNRFRRNFADDPRVDFPQPISELTTDKVLVESFIHGEPILNYCEEGRKPKKDREQLAELGLETVMKMIFLYDFVHGDLHPGNILVNRNNKARGSPLCLNMIDCGLVVEMGERDHVNLVKVLGAFIKRDGNLAGHLMIDTAKKCNANEMDVELFCRGLEKIILDDEEQVSDLFVI